MIRDAYKVPYPSHVCPGPGKPRAWTATRRILKPVCVAHHVLSLTLVSLLYAFPDGTFPILMLASVLTIRTHKLWNCSSVGSFPFCDVTSFLCLYAMVFIFLTFICRQICTASFSTLAYIPIDQTFLHLLRLHDLL